MDFVYKENDTGEQILISDVESAPSNYPPDKYTKLYEVASVDAADILTIHESKCPNPTKTLNLSVDGVSESKSSTVSLDVFTMKMRKCKTIYPCRIVRPIGRVKVSSNEHFEKLLKDVEENNCSIDKLVADKPKRSDLKCIKNHSAYYPCEYC